MEPQLRLGIAALTQLAFEGGDLNALRTELVASCLQNTASAANLMDLSVIDQLLGHQAQGLDWQTKALETCRSYQTYRPDPGRKTLLVYAAPLHMGGNTPVEFLLPHDQFDIVTCYIDPDLDTPPAVPPHDVAFCAAPADADDAQALFQTVRELSAATNRPTLNLPRTLVKPERDTLPQLLNQVPGLRIPRTLRVSAGRLRHTIENHAEAADLQDIGSYPYVVRPVGSHAGFGLAKINTPQEFSDYLAQREEDHFFVGEFINYASDHDGCFRKYRIVLIDGKAFPCHMAISDQWNVWYMNAKMKEAPQKRREEAAFMDQFACEFAPRHGPAMEALAAGIGLEYFGLDCAQDAQGNLVVFEVDNALIVHDMDCKATFPYKAAHMQRIFRAFGDMLERQCNLPAQDAPTKLEQRKELA